MSRTQAWQEVTLGDVCQLKYGKALPESERTGGASPVYGSNGIVGWHNEALTISETIVVGRKGSFGEVTFSPIPCWPIDTTYYVDREATRADLKWLAYRLSGLGLNRLNRAAAVPGLNREDAYRKRLLLPPLDEQRRIAGILDKAAALRAKRRAALAQLDTLTQSIFLDLFGDPATNPKKWPVKFVHEYVQEFQGGKSLEAESGESVVTRNRILKISAVTGMSFVSAESKPVPDSHNPPDEHFVRPGDLLFSRANTSELVGAVALVDEAPCNLLLPDKLWRFVWRAPDEVEPLFVWALFQTRAVRHEIEIRATGTSGSMKNISQAKLLGIQTIMPPLLMQREFSLRLTSVKRLKKLQEMALASLESLFLSLLDQAFSGRL
jgi:type I restriction enzyme S subunit